jgi:hypothetical protein
MDVRGSTGTVAAVRIGLSMVISWNFQGLPAFRVDASTGSQCKNPQRPEPDRSLGVPPKVSSTVLPGRKKNNRLAWIAQGKMIRRTNAVLALAVAKVLTYQQVLMWCGLPWAEQ